MQWCHQIVKRSWVLTTYKIKSKIYIYSTKPRNKCKEVQIICCGCHCWNIKFFHLSVLSFYQRPKYVLSLPPGKPSTALEEVKTAKAKVCYCKGGAERKIVAPGCETLQTDDLFLWQWLRHIQEQFKLLNFFVIWSAPSNKVAATWKKWLFKSKLIKIKIWFLSHTISSAQFQLHISNAQ